VDLHQGTGSYKTPNVVECLNELDEYDVADEPIMENPCKRRREPAHDGESTVASWKSGSVIASTSAPIMSGG